MARNQREAEATVAALSADVSDLSDQIAAAIRALQEENSRARKSEPDRE